MNDATQSTILQCIGLLTGFLEDNCEPEERLGEAYPDIVQTIQILSTLMDAQVGTVGENKMGANNNTQAIAHSSTDNLGEYKRFEEITQKMYAGKISPGQKFDELLDEFEFIFSDDLVDRKRLLAALKRKYNTLTVFIDQEMKSI
jgi:hypothetical protein